jgi:hypothetical protein
MTPSAIVVFGDGEYVADELLDIVGALESPMKPSSTLYIPYDRPAVIGVEP